MVLSGNIKCRNCDSSMQVRWVAVEQEFRSHHVDPDCPLCGADSDFRAWLDEGKRKGQTYLLLSIQPVPNGKPA